MMRSWLSALLIVGCIVGLVVVTGCGKGGGKTPEQTVKRMFKAAKKKDLDGMLACYSPDIREMFEKVMEMQGEDVARKQITGSEDVGKMKILDTKIDGNTAQVKVSITAGGKTEEDSLFLSKIDGVWLLDIPEAEKKGMKRGMEMIRDPETMKRMRETTESMSNEMRRNMPEE